jgi:FMN reductase
MSHLVLISGSPSTSSRSIAVLEYARQVLAAEKLEATIVSVRDFPPEDLILAKYDSPAFDAVKKLIAGASGLIVSTPVYKASYSGSLKTLLDILPQYALRGKTVLPIVTGGSAAHLLAIDYALKPVLSVLGATDLLQGVYIVDNQLSVAPDGKPILPDELRDRLHAALAQLAANVKSRVASA